MKYNLIKEEVSKAEMNTEEIVKGLQTELEAKGFSSIKVADSDYDNTIKVVVNSVKGNKYGASIKSVKYMETFDNIAHWNDNGDSEWYSHSVLCGCSQSAISWLIDQAKKHSGVDFDLVVVYK